MLGAHAESLARGQRHLTSAIQQAEAQMHTFTYAHAGLALRARTAGAEPTSRCTC